MVKISEFSFMIYLFATRWLNVIKYQCFYLPFKINIIIHMHRQMGRGGGNCPPVLKNQQFFGQQQYFSGRRCELTGLIKQMKNKQENLFLGLFSSSKTKSSKV